MQWCVVARDGGAEHTWSRNVLTSFAIDSTRFAMPPAVSCNRQLRPQPAMSFQKPPGTSAPAISCSIDAESAVAKNSVGSRFSHISHVLRVRCLDLTKTAGLC